MYVLYSRQRSPPRLRLLTVNRFVEEAYFLQYAVVMVNFLYRQIRGFIFELPGQEQAPRTTSPPESEDDDTLHDKKDIRYLKELIKNLG